MKNTRYAITNTDSGENINNFEIDSERDAKHLFLSEMIRMAIADEIGNTVFSLDEIKTGKTICNSDDHYGMLLCDIRRMVEAVELAFEGEPYSATPRVYSGRGMYGRPTIGFVCQGSDVFRLVAVLVAAVAQAHDVDTEDFREMYQIGGRFSYDQMGTDMVIYMK